MFVRFTIFFSLLIPLFVHAESKYSLANSTLYDEYPWAISYYHGISCTNPLAHLLQVQFHYYPERIDSIELSYTLKRTNPLRQLFLPLVNITQINTDVTRRKDIRNRTIYEINPYISFRWINFPWNEQILTSLAIGEGISYATTIPSLEKKDNKNARKLLNYLMFELTLISPRYPRLQFIIRIHHRSGAYGLYFAGNTGSNNLGLGIRYLF